MNSGMTSSIEKAVATTAEFMRWWRDELIAMLPERMRKLLCPAQSALTIKLAAGETDAGKNTILMPPDLQEKIATSDPDGTMDPVAALALLDQLVVPVNVHAAAEEVLCRELELPAAVMENLDDVLTFEMDRQTPFHADQVFFAYVLNGKTADKKHIKVKLCLIPKSKVTAALEPLKKWQLQVDSVSTQDDGLQIRFFSRDYLRQYGSKRQYLAMFAALVLLAVIFIIPFWQQRITLDSLQEELLALRQSTQAAQEISSRLDRYIGIVEVLRRHKNNTPPVIDVLDRLSRLLPDSTWIKQLEIENGNVHLQGFSGDASSLIGILEKDAQFSGVHFSSPVTQDAGTGRERFRISAAIVGASP